jgi:nitrogen fixation protein NifX
MRVAFASNDGIRVDEHFGRAGSFQLWEIGPQAAECVGRISGLDQGTENEDHILAKATALEGCVIACSIQIGGPAAAKLVARHIHPLKTTTVVPIQEMVEKFQNVLRGNAPPWLAKAMGLPPARKLTVEEEA